MKQFKLVLKWFFGVLFLLGSIKNLIEASHFISALFSLMLGLFILPPAWKLISEKAKFSLSSKMRWVIAIALLIGIGVFMPKKVSTVENDSLSQEETAVANLPKFSIEQTIQDEATPNKIAFNVRLEAPITEEELKMIGLKIKNDNEGFEKYFILYYLPNMVIGSGAWAKTHFTPNLDLQILGASFYETALMQGVPVPENMIGDWFDQSAGAGIRYLVYIENDSTKMKKVFKDGSVGESLLNKDGDFFVPFDNPELFFKIEDDGKLGFYDLEGKYSEIPPTSYSRKAGSVTTEDSILINKDLEKLNELKHYLSVRDLELCSFYEDLQKMELECIHKADDKFPDFDVPAHGDYVASLIKAERKKIATKFNIIDAKLDEIAVFAVYYCK